MHARVKRAAGCHNRRVTGGLQVFGCFCAGVFLHMCVLHFFRFEETAAHPMIRMWSRPRLASSISASIQLAAGVVIFLAVDYRFAFNFDTLGLVVGSCFWGVLGAVMWSGDRGAAT